MEGGFAWDAQCVILARGNREGGRWLTFAVEEEDNVLAESFAGGAVKGKDLDDFVCELGCLSLVWGWVVGGDHVLFVQDKLT